MKYWIKIYLCLFLTFTLWWVPVQAAEETAFATVYTPSTQEEARCVPLNQELGHLEDDGTFVNSRWETLYNPYTAEMMIELAKASRQVDDGSSKWGSVMKKYGYEQLCFTENNIAYNHLTYRMGWKVNDGQEQPIWFPAVNAIIGIQQVEYNGRTRYAVAITFRGSSDAEDWLCDFTAYSDEEGFHEGFSQNAEYFYNTLSKELSFFVDGQKLTLYDIYNKMQTPDSDFCMVVMGHSLGGALTNMLVGRYLYQHGVHPSNLVGYGFAVPRTSPEHYAAEYPYNNIINVINADDLVPAITLAGHKRIGRDIVYYPDAEFRLAHYAKDYPELADEHHSYWQTIGFFTTGFKPHLIETTYQDIVKIISKEISESTMENPSQYTQFSTCGKNNWDGAAKITPYTFGAYTGDLAVESALVFDGGVLKVAGDLNSINGIVMHNDNDYLKVGGNLNVAWGIHTDYLDHLTAGTVEIQGDFTADNFNMYDYSYHATGTHRTVFSGNQEQMIKINDTDVRFENLYLRNANINIVSYIPYLKLAEDAMITATEDVTVWNMDMNGYTLEVEKNIGVEELAMNGGNLIARGSANMKRISRLDGTLNVLGDFETENTLIFAGGQMFVGGNCNLPYTMVMQNENDYLKVDGILTLFSYDDTIPDNHLSAGTVEVKGNMEIGGFGVCLNNVYQETGTHRTILSGSEKQTLWWSNKVGSPNRFENLCIRNSDVCLNLPIYVRIGEDSTIVLNGEEKLQIHGILDVADYQLNVDTSGWTGDGVPVEIRHIKSDSGSLYVDGDINMADGIVEGRAIISGNLKLKERLTFNDGHLYVGGDCTLPRSLIMKQEDDYLSVGGDLYVYSSWPESEEDHLSAGTVELWRNFYVGDSYGRRSYHASGTHRTVFSGEGVQEVSLSTAVSDEVLQVCLRNPNVILSSTHTLRLMEDTVQNDVSGWNVHKNLDLNGYRFITRNQFNRLENVGDNSSDGVGCLVQVLPDNSLEEYEFPFHITCPKSVEANEIVNVLVAGYDQNHRLLNAEKVIFDSESEMTQTLSREGWSECEFARIFWWNDDLKPFCNPSDFSW